MGNALLEALGQHEKTIRRLLILTFLYLIPVLGALKPIVDPDIWWHFRTGQWIVGHRTFPTTDPFSIYGMGKPWIAYSWLFELVVYGLFRALGLVGIVLYTASLSLLITLTLHTLVRRLEPRFTITVSITALAMAGMLPLLNPRPWLFSILFFVIELDILLTVRQSGNPRRLLFLPLLFVLWANLHIQFIYGLLLLGLTSAEPLIERLLRREPTRGTKETISFRYLFLVTFACMAATFFTPYHIHVYQPIFEFIEQTVPYQYIGDLLPLGFRSPADWFVLGVTLAATFLLGWRRNLRPLPFLLLIAGAFLSFRSRRDAWFVVVSAAAIIASSNPIKTAVEGFDITKLRALMVAGAVLIALVVAVRIRGLSERQLEEIVEKHYPVAATAFVEKHGYTGPLYNDYGWGGYLIWRLPDLMVSMDGRQNVHGDERIERSIKTWRGERDWASDGELASARLVIGNVKHALASLLRFDPRFKLVYEDNVAVVFIANLRNGV